MPGLWKCQLAEQNRCGIKDWIQRAVLRQNHLPGGPSQGNHGGVGAGRRGARLSFQLPIMCHIKAVAVKCSNSNKLDLCERATEQVVLGLN